MLNALVGPDLAFLHGCFAQVVFGLLVSLAVFTSPRLDGAGAGARAARRSGGCGAGRWPDRAGAYLQLVLGAVVRHTDIPARPARLHLLAAFAVVAAWSGWLRLVLERHRGEQAHALGPAAACWRAAGRCRCCWASRRGWSSSARGCCRSCEPDHGRPGRDPHRPCPASGSLIFAARRGASTLLAYRRAAAARIAGRRRRRARRRTWRGQHEGRRRRLARRAALPCAGTRLADYLELTKPRVAVLVLFTVAAGACWPARRMPDPWLLLHAVLRHRPGRRRRQRPEPAAGAAQRRPDAPHREPAPAGRPAAARWRCWCSACCSAAAAWRTWP